MKSKKCAYCSSMVTRPKDTIKLKLHRRVNTSENEVVDEMITLRVPVCQSCQNHFRSDSKLMLRLSTITAILLSSSILISLIRREVFDESVLFGILCFLFSAILSSGFSFLGFAVAFMLLDRAFVPSTNIPNDYYSIVIGWLRERGFVGINEDTSTIDSFDEHYESLDSIKKILGNEMNDMKVTYEN